MGHICNACKKGQGFRHMAVATIFDFLKIFLSPILSLSVEKALLLLYHCYYDSANGSSGGISNMP